MRRWWRYNKIKSLSIQKTLYTKNLHKILKNINIKNFTVKNYFNLKLIYLNRHLIHKYYPNICKKSAKFKTTFKFAHLNRWNLLKQIKYNNIPNVKKFIW
jgi:hypothetical protein